MSEPLRALKQRLARLSALEGAGALASWDQQTNMPPDGAGSRAETLAALAGLSHELFVDDETGRLIDAAAEQIASGGGEAADPDSADVRTVASAQRQWEKARRVPTDLAEEIARAGSLGQDAWVIAREQSDFASFAPYLERNVELLQRYVDCHQGHNGYSCAYDVLLDDYEPAMPTAEVARLFGELKDELIPVINKVRDAAPVDDAPLFAPFPTDGQRALALDVLKMMGFTDHGWRLDDTVHPFAIRIGPGDVRVTSRWDEAYWPTSLYGSMHECGHGLYEDGIAPELARTPVGSIESLSMHESQSRLWENMVGRGRPFSDVLAPRIAKLAGGALSSIEPETLFAAVNRVTPSLIRIEADEATYALHIILRFELEQQLIEGTLAVTDLPEAWRARVSEYFALAVPDDAHGVLQDVHWSSGMLGYFPTYALGNLIAGQLWERAHTEIDDLDGKLSRGELGDLREWLRLRVHRHGSKFPTEELLRREGGGPISVAPFMRYLKDKLAAVYGVSF
jgi:carboxypeptidase Taq